MSSRRVLGDLPVCQFKLHLIGKLDKAHGVGTQLTELAWFKNLYGTCSIAEENGKRWCEIRYASASQP